MCDVFALSPHQLYLKIKMHDYGVQLNKFKTTKRKAIDAIDAIQKLPRSQVLLGKEEKKYFS